MHAPLNYFSYSFGPASAPTLLLDWIFTAICLATCLIVLLLLAGALLHKRKPLAPGAIIHDMRGLKWVYLGTGLSVFVLFFLVVYSLAALNKTAMPDRAPGLTLDVTGYDWWWKTQYNDGDPGQHFETANEIHIPVGMPVLIRLRSADVIHAFWAPLLAGKTEMIPGLVNQQWLQADAPGRYYGKCTQFCGLQHAHMDFEIVAESPADFQAWQARQRQAAPLPANIQAARGQAVFAESCAACHGLRGASGKGGHAPDLTHLLSRRLIAAGLLTNTPEHLRDWIAHAQELKPGSRMPDIALLPGDASALSVYLATLK